jgi:hypothetical protein
VAIRNSAFGTASVTVRTPSTRRRRCEKPVSICTTPSPTTAATSV